MEIRPFHTSLVTTRYSYVPLKHSLAIGLFGPERDQLATPWAHAEGPDRRSTTLVEPLPDRVPPHLESFLAQLAEQVLCAIRSFIVYFAFLVSVGVVACIFVPSSHFMHCAYTIPALSAGVFF